MFAKLLKYEWKATAPTLGILSGVAVLLCLAGGLIGRKMMDILFAMEESSTGETFMLVGIVLALVVIYLSLIAYGLAGELLLLYRFYKNKFTDEGYLTFTLPVTANKLFLSSWINASVWMGIVNVILVSGLVFMFGMILTAEGFREYGVLEAIGQGVSEALGTYGIDESMRSELNTVGFIVIGQLALSPLYGMAIPMTSIVLGAVVAKKHKLLAALGIYYGISTLSGLVTGVIDTILTVIRLFSDGDMSAYTGTVAQILLQVAFAIGGYYLSVHLMRKKLNLP